MGLKEVSVNTRNWVDSAQEKDYSRELLNGAMDLLVPYTIELVY